jgi:hypothetical protein
MVWAFIDNSCLGDPKIDEIETDCLRISATHSLNLALSCVTNSRTLQKEP